MKDGFTLAEALVVIAIIVVLGAAAVPTGMGVRNNVRQIQLNRSAEILYMTAQRNLVMKKLSGESVALSATSVTSADTTENKNKVLPANTVSPELYRENWVIQYTEWTVETVYYSETETIAEANLSDEKFAALSAWKTDQTGKVGWYGK